MNEENVYLEELKKFVKKKVIVTTTDGEKFVGELRGINFAHLSVVLMTEKEKIIIKHVKKISRLRGE